jgi:hypothetical protein
MLRLSFAGETPTTASGAVHDWSVFQRTARGLIALVGFWAAGAVLIFPIVPILHLILSPTCFLLGPVIAALRATEKRRLMEMKGTCPRCKVERSYKLGIRFNGKRTFTCDGCGNLIDLEEA